jgi:uncharacterized protein (DUF362 family)
MNRRSFIKNAALLSAGMVASPNLVKGAFAADGPLVVMAKDGDAKKLVRDALGALGGMESFVAKGQIVVVKPNIGWDRKPEQAANTNPEVVREVVRMCLAAGAAKVKVFDRTCNDPRRSYVTSGIATILEEINDDRVEVSQIDDRKFRKVESPEASVLKRGSYYEDVLDADLFINVPVAKHHSASGLTIGMKNVMGVIGGNRAVLHRRLAEALVDMNRVVRSHLTVVDATRVLVANGPQGGRVEDVEILGTVLASTDVVAVDAVTATLFGKSMHDLSYLQLAHEKGLGVADIARIQLKMLSA